MKEEMIEATLKRIRHLEGKTTTTLEEKAELKILYKSVTLMEMEGKPKPHPNQERLQL